MAKKALGRGLGAIFGDDAARTPVNRPAVKTAGTEEKKESPVKKRETKAVKDTKESKEKENVSRETNSIRISLIEPNKDQPRKSFDDERLSELAESIKRYGVIEPIVVKKEGRIYRIVVGERRWRAARLAGLKEIPCVVRDLDNREAAEIAVIENIQREDLDPVEEAAAYKTLIDEYHMTQEELSERLSKSRSAIANSMRLLQLDEKVLELVKSGELSAGHARTLLSVSGKAAQYKAAREVINDRLSVRQTEQLVKRMAKEKKAAQAEKEAKNAKNAQGDAEAQNSSEEQALNTELYIKAAAESLSTALGTRVSIKAQNEKKGKIEIEYYSQEELNRLIEILG